MARYSICSCAVKFCRFVTNSLARCPACSSTVGSRHVGIVLSEGRCPSTLGGSQNRMRVFAFTFAFFGGVTAADCAAPGDCIAVDCAGAAGGEASADSLGKGDGGTAGAFGTRDVASALDVPPFGAK